MADRADFGTVLEVAVESSEWWRTPEGVRAQGKPLKTPENPPLALPPMVLGSGQFPWLTFRNPGGLRRGFGRVH